MNDPFTELLLTGDADGVLMKFFANMSPSMKTFCEFFAHQWSPLDVIGESYLSLVNSADIGRQPTPDFLRSTQKPVALSTPSVSAGGLITFKRTFHRMEDAMDPQARSLVFHPTSRPGHADLVHHLGQDFGH